MEAKDLMLGDWVQTPEGPNKVYKILDDEIWVGDFKASARLFEGQFQPIPLSAEILEKNGFIKVRDFLWEIRTQDTCIKYEWRRKIMLEITNKLTKKDEYGRCNIAALTVGWLDDMFVHELQHAFRLCGIEKEITL